MRFSEGLTIAAQQRAAIFTPPPGAPAGVSARLDGQVLVEAALDPTANQSSRLLALSGLEYAVLVPEGHKLSFVTRS